ncbi:tRNA delta(2)-isopentenylpyrophosphate transferase [Alkalihalobacillus alcalophilus ATCC 27647 = CGMCC 1.3604]|uniref:tRNA dimethylallyltransferase n=1 Tax=Alkalihalobacillus alcalophilus ATCC 27647 = CGMCC 1.3604 TaxID=1218173 RepID=A0A094XI99_ALKAL|nr:tRNA (adenosine(37)-N6)-dimethylallyltransferase MiaA [Alkalihalobacillus alcalophilus]KGA98515.1 tRNA delta(2)-isopentenylpyrophosphate transferase [Alkalihalobacillus alcalophilus ATCC 27647 = CGMCC 1.3604]MED1562665.1 tRNA (adenosine(37)-N6)-dimethylallyltransferase MiaA [Alkalihalobacillus alcalophilus]THG90746.1 tRNA delta(2)-isopentenylpyrophosphate transferase [Alkalihalobacillus alcalophilus ATCC 27647 = CGMCC 1.3604]
MKEDLISIVGPTGVGKTALSIELAKKYGGEIISGDSMQIYRGMDIGTAKVNEEEMQGIPHHLIDIKDPNEAFSVADFQELVVPLITRLNQKKKVPILTGGTGLYVNSIIKGYQFSETEEDLTYRKELEQFVSVHGVEALYTQLLSVDPDAKEVIHPNNIRRVIRALEVFKVTGISFTKQQKNMPEEERYHLAMIGLTMPREQLYERINSRVDMMVKNGLIEEVEHLYNQGIKDVQSVQAIGYKELYSYFDGLYSLEEAIEKLKQNSRRYAKRQYTWFRNKTNTTWFDVSEGLTEKVFLQISEFVEGNLKNISK